jgi:hypothetical protein
MFRFEVISEAEAVERYEDILDSEGPLTLAGMSYARSYVLREVDPVAYRCGFNDFVDSLTEDGIYVEGITDSEIEDDGQPDEAQEWADFDADC